MRKLAKKNLALLNQLSLPFDLIPFSLSQILHFEIFPCDLYSFEEQTFKLHFKENSLIPKKDLAVATILEKPSFFIQNEEEQKIQDKNRELLRLSFRSLSVSPGMSSCQKALNLLCLNFSSLYFNPLDIEGLNLQYQCLKILLDYFNEHPTLLAEALKNFEKQRHPYLFAQPMISSLMALLFLQKLKIIGKQSEIIVMASFFKDIGMGFFPKHWFLEKRILSSEELYSLQEHPQHSCNVLHGKIPLARIGLEIIKFHHCFTNQEAKRSSIVGLETAIVSMMDIYTAMISSRPYRKAYSPYEALSYLKEIFQDPFPLEFKYFVLMVNSAFLKK